MLRALDSCLMIWQQRSQVRRAPTPQRHALTETSPRRRRAAAVGCCHATQLFLQWRSFGPLCDVQPFERGRPSALADSLQVARSRQAAKPSWVREQFAGPAA